MEETKRENMTDEQSKEEKTPKEPQGFFDKEGVLSRVLGKIGSLILANIYFVVCCIPILTIGASITSLIRVCYLINDGADFNLTKEFFTTFVHNLLDATVGWVLFGALLGASGLGIWHFVTTEYSNATQVIGVGVCGILAIVFLTELTYYFALLTRYENTILNQMKNAFLLGLVNIVRTVLIWIIWAVPIAAFALSTDLIKYAGWLWLLAGFSLFTVVTCSIYKKIFKMFETKEED